MVRMQALTLTVLSLLLAGCGSDPAVVWLARNPQAPQPVKEAVAKRAIAVGMPKDAAVAVIRSLGFPILEEKALPTGSEHVVYRQYAYDSVGKRHSAMRFLIFRDGVLVAFETLPER